MSERTQVRTQVPRGEGPGLRVRRMDREHHRYRFRGVGTLPVPAARAYAALERAENRPHC
ncbi:hypothetical protein ACFYY3_15235 [Streptomyces sp. NPDC001812]|uniref:Uncharacterized protein n=1 Tax=Streptomyces cathayae TaxID=3031124 RepID=A0ABY8K0K1_9ACTN|nr:hypothetical protein [Streptomyces sp. HUAS 5]WGD41777.1 hypothetical protein PYS65_17315 [Streptomyces sp. HUAS 5]